MLAGPPISAKNRGGALIRDCALNPLAARTMYGTMASMEIPLFVVFTRQPLQRQRSVGRLRSPTAARRLIK